MGETKQEASWLAASFKETVHPKHEIQSVLMESQVKFRSPQNELHGKTAPQCPEQLRYHKTCFKTPPTKR